MAKANTEAHAVEPTPKFKKKFKRAKRGRKAAAALPVALMSKADAVRAALKAGMKKPAEGADFIKEKFGIEIGAQMFSAYKSQFAAKKAARKARKAVRGGIVDNGRPRMGSTVGNGKVIDLILEVRKLSDQYGAETVAKMAQALGQLVEQE
jgi:hypothetical protein